MNNRKPIQDPDLIPGHYTAKMNDGAKLYLTVINTEPLAVQNVFIVDTKEPFSGYIGEADIYAMTKEERQDYFDIMRGEELVAKYPHYQGEDAISAGLVYVSDDGNYAEVLTVDIPQKGHYGCSTMNRVNLKEGRRVANEELTSTIFKLANLEISNKYWKIIYEDMKQRSDN